jgi:hypothetical protein
MKQHLKNIVLTAGLSVILGSNTLSAQDQRAAASIPFAYHVGQQTLPQGTYMIQETSARGVLQMRSKASGHAIFVPVILADTGKKHSKLTFGCYAGQCSLSQISMAGDVYKLRARPPVRLASNQLGVAAMISVPLR